MRIPFKDIKSMVLSGFKSSFLPFHEKQAHLRRTAAELALYDDVTGERHPDAQPDRAETASTSSVRTSN
jgi:hypothetical protein